MKRLLGADSGKANNQASVTRHIAETTNEPTRLTIFAISLSIPFDLFFSETSIWVGTKIPQSILGRKCPRVAQHRVVNKPTIIAIESLLWAVSDATRLKKRRVRELAAVWLSTWWC